MLWVDSIERYDVERRAWETKKCTNSKHLTTSLVLLKICLNNANMAKVSSFVPPLHRFWFKKLIGRTLWYGNDNLASQIKRVYSFVVFQFLDHNFHGHIYFPLSVSLCLSFSLFISGQRKKPTQQGKHWKKDINTLNNLKWSWKCSSRSIGSIFWFMNQSFGVWLLFAPNGILFSFLFNLWQTLRFAMLFLLAFFYARSMFSSVEMIAYALVFLAIALFLDKSQLAHLTFVPFFSALKEKKCARFVFWFCFV